MMQTVDRHRRRNRARIEKAELVDVLLGSRDRLTPREWGIVQLYYNAGVTQAEIAEAFGVGRPTITKSLAAARRKAAGLRPYSDKPLDGEGSYSRGS